MEIIKEAMANCEVLQKASPASLAVLTGYAGLKRLTKPDSKIGVHIAGSGYSGTISL